MLNSELVRYNRIANVIISCLLIVILFADHFVIDKFSLDFARWLVLSLLLVVNLVRQTVTAFRSIAVACLIINTVIVVIGAYSFMYLQLIAWAKSFSGNDQPFLLSVTILLDLLLMISCTMQIGSVFRRKKKVKYRQHR